MNPYIHIRSHQEKFRTRWRRVFKFDNAKFAQQMISTPSNVRHA